MIPERSVLRLCLGTDIYDQASINFVYPVLPWIGLMASGYVFGAFYKKDFPAEQRRRWLFIFGICATLLFILLRGFNLYGEPRPWQIQNSWLNYEMSESGRLW